MGKYKQEIISRLEKTKEKANALNEKELRIEEKDIKLLREPKRILLVNFPVKTLKGIEIINGYRVQYNDALGPTKGGIRFHPEVDLEEVTALGFWMALKCSLLGLPYGGAKGGITINPKEYNEEELEEISRAYVRQIKDFIGPMKDVPAPDVYTNPTIMGWMSDEFNKLNEKPALATFTGKPLNMGGIEGRSYSTSKGGEFILKKAVEKYDIPKNSRVAIQGFGNVGGHLAEFLYKEGFKIIAISDSKGGIYSEKGINIPKLIEYKKESGNVCGFEDLKEISNEDLLEIETDILIPAALSNAITNENADKIKAKIILELANGPITSEADEILNKKQILVLPDILSNAGGVVVSYFEWCQNLANERWTEKEVLEKLEKKMNDAFDILYKEYVSKFGLDFRTSAYIHSIIRILNAEKERI